jgi:hypothetical protein
MKRMQYTSLLALALVVGLATGCAKTPPPLRKAPAATDIPPQPENTAKWEIVLKTEIEQPMRMAAFVDETTGFTGGASDGGKAHKTTDGGESWTLAESSKG